MTAVNVLLVEDNKADAVFIQEAFKLCKSEVQVQVAQDGDDALNYLYRRNGYGKAPAPDLILLDLNLPRVDGIEVLKEIKQHPSLKQIPVIILTSSSAEQDIKRGYENYANGYVIKPVGLEKMKNALATIEDFWFRLAKLPPPAL